MMTIKEKIDAYVLAQGNQVGAGAELASLLKEIVDSIPGEYTLPPASAETLGGVKVGSGLSITEQGVLSASGGGSALIVEGTLDETSFTPNEGQPTLNDAFQAIAEGRTVIICIQSDDGNIYYHWLGCNTVDGYITFEQNIIW